jgi:ferredoxin
MSTHHDDAEFEVVLDGSKCQGYGLCLGIAPDVFDMPDGSPVAIVLRSDVPGDELATMHEAIRNCPAGAISLMKIR